MIGWINSVVESFIPESIALSSDTILKTKARAIVSLQFFCIGLGLASYIMGVLISADNSNVLLGGLVLALCLLFFIACLNIFKYTANIELTANLICTAAYGGMCATTFIAGGIHDTPALPLLLTLPMLANVLASWRVSLIWCGVILLTVFGFLMADFLGCQFPQQFSDGHNEQMRIINFIISIFFCILLFGLMDRYMIVLKLQLPDNPELEISGDILSIPTNELPSSDQFRHILIKEINYSALNDGKSVLAMIDIDYNEDAESSLGERIAHAATDHIGLLLQEKISDNDKLIYLGNNRFLILLSRLNKSVDVNPMLVELSEKIIEGVDAPLVVSVGGVELMGFEEDIELILETIRNNLILAGAQNQKIILSEVVI